MGKEQSLASSHSVDDCAGMLLQFSSLYALHNVPPK